jgi:hypothetical protein
VIALVEKDRQNTLLLRKTPDRPGEWYFEIRLCGEDETVFFDI